MSRRARLDQVEPPVVYPGALAVQILLSERMWEEAPRVAGGNYALLLRVVPPPKANFSSGVHKRPQPSDKAWQPEP